MSRNVMMKASIMNRPTCGGSKKAGLAPSATSFMMGVKPNRAFRGSPFVDNKKNYHCGANSDAMGRKDQGGSLPSYLGDVWCCW